MKTSERPRDYARYGRERVGTPPLPNNAAEVTAVALRLYRSRLGPLLSASLVPSLTLVAALMYTFQFALPGLTTTASPNDVARQVGEFAVGILVALFVAIPLAVLALAGIATAAAIEVVAWAGLGAVSAQGSYARGVRIFLRVLLVALAPMLVGLGLVLLAGLSLVVLPENSPVPGILGIVGGLLAALGGLIGIVSAARGSGAVAAGLYEGVGARAALTRVKALAKARGGYAMGQTSVESALVYGVFAGAILLVGTKGLDATLGVSKAVSAAMGDGAPGLVAEQVLTMLPWFLTVWLLLPYLAVTAALSYFERRVAVEGFDIELMAERLESRPRARR